MTKDYAIIVAGGKGLRMGGDIPKQFLPIGGIPVLMRTLNRFWEYDADLQIILVLPKEQQPYWHSLCEQYAFPLPQSGEAGRGLFPQPKDTGRRLYLLADGGATRFHSVQNGLALIPDDAEGVVGVHDGVRPFVTVEVIRRCYEAARTHKAVIPVTPVVETLRHIEGEATIQHSTFNTQHSTLNTQHSTFNTQPSTTVPRSDYRLVQTPQVFDIPLLKQAYRQPYTEVFTDDASVAEALGQEVTLMEGCRENIKITTPYDLSLAEFLLSHEAHEAHKPH